MKKCSSCQKIKNLDDFHKKKYYKNGYNARCRDCINEYHRKRDHKDPTLPKHPIINHKRFHIPGINNPIEYSWKDTNLDEALDFFLATFSEQNVVISETSKEERVSNAREVNRVEVVDGGEGGGEEGNGEDGCEEDDTKGTIQFSKSNWVHIFTRLRETPEFRKLCNFINLEIKTYLPDLEIYPPPAHVFRAFMLTPLDSVKVVILGQDPYHGPRQANGMCFSVPEKICKFPPSLRNIFKELHSDIGCFEPTSGDLSKWARQGVLLLNTSLTVRQHCANSHSKLWLPITDNIIKYISDYAPQRVVFILWGNPAQNRKKFIDLEKHFVVESVHPSPLSAYRGFFGSKPFSKCNSILKETGRESIVWELLD